MIEQHSALARRLAEELGCSVGVQEAVGAAYEQWDGRGWPGDLTGDDIPIASRLGMIGEFVEVAHRIGGTGAAIDAGREARRVAVRPSTRSRAVQQRRDDSRRSRRRAHLGRGDRRRARPGRPLSDAEFDAGPAGDRRLRGPQVAVHAGPCACRLGAGRRGGDEARARGRGGRQLCAGRAWPTASVVSACRTPSGTSVGRSGRRGVGAGAHAPVSHRTDAPSVGRAGPARALSPCSTGSVSTARATPVGSREGRSPRRPRVLGAADAYQSMCEPRPYRDALTPEVAAKELRAEVKAGRMDGDVVEAVLGRGWPSGRPSP